MRLADYVVSFLAERGVRDIFAVTGGGCIFLCDALGRDPAIKYYCCHHEQAVTTAAEAYARVKNDLGVALVTVGPGATNAITGTAGAWIDSVPQLVLSGQAFLNQTIRKTGLRQLGLQELNIIDMVRPITKYAVTVEHPDTIKYHLERALHLALSGRPGPVWIEIPADVQNAQIEPAAMGGFTPSDAGAGYDADLNGKVRKVANLLREAKRPLIHVGQGVRLSGAIELFLEFVTRQQIPFVTARNANDIVESDHALLVGRPGIFGQRAANFAVQTADVYLALGTRLALGQTGYSVGDFARNAVRIAVDIDQAELQKPGLSLDIPIHHDVGAFLQELRRELDEPAVQCSSWRAQCQAWKNKYPVVLPEHRDQAKYINSFYFTEVLSELLQADAIVVTDMGLSFQGTHQAFSVKKGQRFFTNSGFASMGWGLPAAVGACIAGGNKTTVCISGDGGLQMNVQELATIMHHRLPVKLFIFNNGGYLTIKQTQELGFEGRLMGVNEATGISFPDFVALGKAYGIPSTRIDSHAELSQRLQEVLTAEGPSVCEVILDPSQEQGPKVVKHGERQARLEDMHPFLPDEELREIMDSVLASKKALA